LSCYSNYKGIMNKAYSKAHLGSLTIQIHDIRLREGKLEKIYIFIRYVKGGEGGGWGLFFEEYSHWE